MRARVELTKISDCHCHSARAPACPNARHPAVLASAAATVAANALPAAIRTRQDTEAAAFPAASAGRSSSSTNDTSAVTTAALHPTT